MCRRIRSRSEPKERVPTMALRNSLLMSKRGVKVQLMPLAKPSIAKISVARSVAVTSSTAAMPRGLGRTTPPGWDMRLPSRSAVISKGTGACVWKSSRICLSKSASPLTLRAIEPRPSRCNWANSSGSSVRISTLINCASFCSWLMDFKTVSTQVAASSSSRKGN